MGIYNHSTTVRRTMASNFSVSDTYGFPRSTPAQKLSKDLVLAGNEIPEPGPDDAPVKNHAVSLNPMDLYSTSPKAGFLLMKNFP